MVYSVIPLSANLRQSILGPVSFWYHECHVASWRAANRAQQRYACTSIRSYLVKRYRYIWWLFIILCTACTSAPDAAPLRSTATPSVEQSTTAPTIFPTIASTVPPTAAPSGTGLPAPVYLIANEQVMRLEPDGNRLTQITYEPQPVYDLSVATDGTLVYLTGNELVALDGRGRRTLLREQAISLPRISPDGQQIAYHLTNPAPGLVIGRNDSPDGIYLSQISGGRPSLLIAYDPEPDVADFSHPAWRYLPVAWSPAGERLLLYAVMRPEMGIPGGEAVIIGPDVSPVRTFSCCEEELWSVDGREIAVAGGGPGPDVRFGLYLIDAARGVETAVLAPTATTIPLVRSPQRLADGAIYAFVELVSTDNFSWEYPFQPRMVRITNDGTITPLRHEPLAEPIAVLWDAQARGALVRFATANTLVWLPIDATLPAQTTRAEGIAFTWAPSADLTARDCSGFTDLAPQPTPQYDPAVADIQGRLATLGFDPGHIDGRFGPLTAAAVRAFRTVHGLTPGDTIDCASWKLLLHRSIVP